ncbi:ion channel [Lactococcus sp.]|uniref:ion channel n=1 Tax=Lactococcus sp. TaxID=44273 RepID=UPI0035B26A55
MKTLQLIYDNEIYTIFIIIIALISLFTDLPTIWDYGVDIIFVLDLIMATIIYYKSSDEKSLKNYFKLHTLDIVACIPIQCFAIFKTFRLIRLVRISRLFKLTRYNEVERKITFHNLFSFNTFKELSIWLAIYLIGNVYVFKEIEHVSILNAIYWLITTITSVGYGDIVPKQTITKIMAMILMILGVAIMGYLNGVITTNVIQSIEAYKGEK